MCFAMRAAFLRLAPLAAAARVVTPGMSMTEAQKHNPLHGLTLETILNELVAFFGWQDLGQRIDIRCFTQDPSVGSSLKFLRKTPWARSKVESLYLFMKRERSCSIRVTTSSA